MKAMIVKTILSTVFRKIQSFFYFGQEHNEDFRLHAVLFEVLPERLSDNGLAEMTNLVAQLQLSGLPATIDTPTEHIPDGYIGMLSVWYGGLREYPKRLLLPQGYFDKTQSV